jgi:hypothetical protein
MRTSASASTSVASLSAPRRDTSPFAAKLRVDGRHQPLGEPASRQLAAEPAERRLVRHRRVQRQPHKAPGAQPIQREAAAASDDHEGSLRAVCSLACESG